MKIIKLKKEEFRTFADKNFLRNHMQSEEYARLMNEFNYESEFLGLSNDNGNIVAASLILTKKIGLNMKYGYAPKGFLLNYYDEALLKSFIEELKKYYSKKNIVFIKINPEIVVSSIDNKTYRSEVNPNMKLKTVLTSNGFTKLKDNLYFESLEPRYNAYINLKSSTLKTYFKTCRNKVRNSRRKGLYIEKGTEYNIEDVYKFFTTGKSLNYYKHMFNIYNNSVDLVLVRVNYEEFIKSDQILYDKELNNNSLYNEILHRSHRPEDLNKKMASDSRLCTIKNEIVYATEGLKNSNNSIVAGAFVIRYGNRVHIVESGFDRNCSSLNANYFLYDAIINMYKDKFDYLDLNGISGDFKKSNPFRGLNRFKLGFNPNIYEYIGEFDLVFNKMNYDYLATTGKLAKEFNKK